MKKFTKRSIAIAVTIALILSSIAIGVFAAGDKTLTTRTDFVVIGSESSNDNTAVRSEHVKKGDKIRADVYFTTDFVVGNTVILFAYNNAVLSLDTASHQFAGQSGVLDMYKIVSQNGYGGSFAIYDAMIPDLISSNSISVTDTTLQQYDSDNHIGYLYVAAEEYTTKTFTEDAPALSFYFEVIDDSESAQLLSDPGFTMTTTNDWGITDISWITNDLEGRTQNQIADLVYKEGWEYDLDVTSTSDSLSFCGGLKLDAAGYGTVDSAATKEITGAYGAAVPTSELINADADLGKEFVGWSTAAAAASPTTIEGVRYYGGDYTKLVDVSGATVKADGADVVYSHDASDQPTQTLYAVYKDGNTTYKVTPHFEDPANPGTYLDGSPKENIGGTTGDSVNGTTASGNISSTNVPAGIDFAGYEFDADKYTTDYGANGFTLNGDPADNGIDVYYKLKEFKVTYELDGKGAFSDTPAPTNPVSVKYGATIPAEPGVTANPGYTFDEWSYTDSYVAGYVMPAKDLTATAQYIANTYTVNYITGDGSSVPSQTQSYSETAPKFTETESSREGFTFKGWTVPGQADYFDFSWDQVLDKSTLDTGTNYTLDVTADWEIESYTIAFEENGGSDVADITKTFGDATGYAGDPIKEGYTFGGWYEDAALTTAYTVPATMPDLGDNGAVKTVYAKWDIESYTINFDSKGGTDVAPISQAYNTDVTAPEAPVKEGAYFGGWYTDDTYATEYTVPAKMPDLGDNGASITVYAKWLDEAYTIKFEENGGSEVADITKDYNEATGYAGDPTRDGYTFDGWYEDAALTTAYTVPANMPDLGDNGAVKTVYAKWTALPFTITYDLADGTAAAGMENPKTFNCDETITKPDDPTREGYTFGGWKYTKEADGTDYAVTEGTTKMPAFNLKAVAVWNVNPYTVTFETNGGSAIDPQERDYNTEITKPGDPVKTGYTFEKWYSDPELTTEFTWPANMPAKDITLYAGYTLNSHTLSWKYTNPETDAEVTDSKTVDYGAAVDDNLPVPETLEGYAFAWDDHDATMPDKDYEVTGKYVAGQNKVTWTYTKPGETEPVEKEETLPFKTALTEPAVDPIEGYTFKWGDHPAVMGTTDITVIGEFTPNNYNLTWTYTKPGEDKATEETTSVAYKSDITEPAAPAVDGYTFKWDDHPATMPANDLVIEGKFEEIDYTGTWTVTDPVSGTTTEMTTGGKYGNKVEEPAFTIPEGFEGLTWETYPETYTDNFTVKGTLIPKDVTITWTYTDPVTGESKSTTTTGKYGDPVVPPVIEGITFPEAPASYPATDTSISGAGEVKEFKDTYKIVRMAKDGTVIETEDYKEFTGPNGTTYTVPAQSDIAGYTFVDVTLDGAAATPDGKITTADREYHYNYVINYYTITYVLDGATYDQFTDVMYGSEAKAYQPATEPTKAPDADGTFVFEGWKTADGKTPASYGAVDGDITFTGSFAHVSNDYVLSFYDDDNQLIERRVYKAGDAIDNIPEAPKKFGYVFTGWSPAVPATMPENDLDVYATYEVDKAFVGVVVGGVVVSGIVVASIAGTNAALITGGAIVGGVALIAGATILAKNTHKVTYLVDGEVYKCYYILEGMKVIVPEDPTKDGYTFTGWDSEIPEKMPDYDLEFNATWAGVDGESDGDAAEVDGIIPNTGSATAGIAAFAIISSAAAAAYVLRRKKNDD